MHVSNYMYTVLLSCRLVINRPLVSASGMGIPRMFYPQLIAHSLVCLKYGGQSRGMIHMYLSSQKCCLLSPKQACRLGEHCLYFELSISTEDKHIELKGRGCRERMDRLVEKIRAEDSKSLKG